MGEKKSLQILNEFGLKLLAMLFMTLDHIGVFLMRDPANYDVGYFLRAAGRLAFPLFVFMLVEGLRHSHDLKKYLLRLAGLYALVTLIETIYVYGFAPAGQADSLDPEPFTDLLMYALVIFFFKQKGWRKVFALLPIAFLCLSFGVFLFEQAGTKTVVWFPRFLRSGYSLFGLAMTILFYFVPRFVMAITRNNRLALGISDETFVSLPEYQRQNNLFTITSLVIVVLVFWGISYIGRTDNYAPLDVYLMGLESYCLLCIPFLYLYNGQRGHDSKAWRYISYFYFPVHIAILLLIFGL